MKKKVKYTKMDNMGDILNPATPPQPGDPSTRLYSNDHEGD